MAWTKEKQKAYKKAYYKANKDKINAHRKSYREANKDEINAYQKAYYEANKDKINAHRKSYYEAYRKANKDNILVKRKAYYEANKDIFKANHRRRRALKIGAHYENYKDMDIFERDGWICGICGTKINKRLKWPNPRSKSIDHIVALVNGGSDAPINLQSAHLRCNLSKGVGLGGQLRLIG